MEQPSERSVDIYGGRDPLLAPAYSITHAARYLGVPRSTVRAWVLGRSYKTGSGRRNFKPFIKIADAAGGFLSFRNLIEIHVIAAIRRGYGIRVPEVRKALRYLTKKLGTQHPLAEVQMLTDGKDLFVERYGELVNITQAGQLSMKKIIELYLERIDRDPEGVPIRLFPFATSREQEDRRPVTIDPRLQFGRPCITGTRVPTEEVVERYKAGESIGELAEDFGCSGEQIEAAIRYELRAAA